ncbi:TPA: hypothetical protein GXZ54_02510 [bacterium]|nr:hypothetical protein [bacterium]
MRYFISSVRYNWTDPIDIGFIQDKENGVYIDPNDKSKWKKMRMLDLGWGVETGLYRLPVLEINELFKIVFEYKKKINKVLSDEDYNFYGALSYLIQYYPHELIDEFTRRLYNKTLHRKSYSELIKFLDREFQCADNIFDKLSDKNQKELIMKWKQLKSIGR